MTECPNCHAILPQPPERFCASCGADLEAMPPAYPPPPPPYLPAGGADRTAPLGGQTPWERRNEIGFFNALIETTKQVLSQPTAFFQAMPVTGGLGGPLLYAVIVGYVGLFASTIYNLVFRSVLTSSLSRMGSGSDIERLAGYMQGGAAQIATLIFGPVLLLIWLFVHAGIFHLALLAMGGAARGFEATLRVAAYSQAASIFNVIPGCGGVVGLVYTLVLLVIGLSEAHGISRGKAAAAVIVPFVLFCCCCVGLIGMAAFGMAGVLGRMR